MMRSTKTRHAPVPLKARSFCENLVSTFSLPALAHVFIESKNVELPSGFTQLAQQEFDGVDRAIGLRMRRRTYIFLRISAGTSNSSLRVPERVMSIAGKTRLSETLRSRMISELPVL